MIIKTQTLITLLNFTKKKKNKFHNENKNTQGRVMSNLFK